MNMLTRREFCRMIGFGAVGTAGAFWLNVFQRGGGKKASSRAACTYRILPREGERYPRSFLKLARTRRFHSLAEAVASVPDKKLGFHVAKINL